MKCSFFFLWLFVVGGGGLFLALNLTVPVGLGSDDIGRVRAVIFSYTYIIIYACTTQPVVLCCNVTP